MSKIILNCTECKGQIDNLVSIDETIADDVRKLTFVCESCGNEDCYNYPEDKIDSIELIYKDSLNRGDSNDKI